MSQSPRLAPEAPGEKSAWPRQRNIVMLVVAFVLACLLLSRMVWEDWISNYLRSLVLTKPTLFAAALFFSAVGLVLLVCGFSLGRTVHLYRKDLPSVVGQLKKDHDSTSAVFKDWMKNANGVLSQAAKGALREMWLSQPWEYVALLEGTDDAYSQSRAGHHIGSITLYGTMVGFAFLLPEPLRNHACRARGQFKNLRILASDTTIKVDGNDRCLVHYPLWLAASLTRELTTTCRHFCHPFPGQTPPKLEIAITYFPDDITSAILHLPPQEVVVLQALDVRGLERVLAGDELQVGFRYANAPQGREAYDRFEAALENLQQSSRPREVWAVSSDAGNATLSIENPHWTYEARTGTVALLTASQYSNGQQSIPLVGTEVTKCLGSLLSSLESTGHSGTDIQTISQLALAKRSIWQGRYHMDCPCRAAVAMPGKMP